ncbi:MAG: WYL domain-containing protein [Phaeodactylibacter sp.]|uniref:helix-turn-helix transcriptional regulator n=1 Tax=Phaeodactylibacter sp. TaxID=1940289 RepID=UPI0032ED128F
MATNRHAMIRYRTIDRCLTRRNKRYWTWKELAAACGEELREYEGGDRAAPARDTIKMDIQNMRSGVLGYRAPIQWYPRIGGYAYSDLGFSITKMPLGTADVEALREAMSLLRQFRGFPQVQGVERVVAKVSEALRVRPSSEPEVLQLEDNMISKGREWLDLLYRACRDQRCLLLEYHPFKVPEGYRSRRIVSPHLVKEYNNRWFLFAYDHQEYRIRTYAFDRIQQAEVYLLDEFRGDPAFHPEQFFAAVIGVSVPEGAHPIQVLLSATPQQARYIETKPLHHSQRIHARADDGSLTFAYQLVHNIELENQLLSFGESVEVLAPTSLREAIAKRVSLLYKRYL